MAIVFYDESFELLDGGHQAVTVTDSATYVAAALTVGAWYKVECTVDTYVAEMANGSTAATSGDHWLASYEPVIVQVKKAKPWLSFLRASATSGTAHVTKIRQKG